MIELEVCDCLPLVCRDKPLVVFSPAGQVDDKLVFIVAEGGENALEALFAELGVGEEVRCDYDLLRPISSLPPVYSSIDTMRSTPKQFQSVCLTFSAPLSIHSCAFASVIPPPTCMPPFHASSASCAAASLPGPSIITCAPASSCCLYSDA